MKYLLKFNESKSDIYIVFKNKKLVVDTTKKYKNDRIAIILTYKGQEYCTPSINVPEFDLEPNEIIIKNDRENNGIFQILINANIITDTGKVAEYGYNVTSPIGKLV